MRSDNTYFFEEHPGTSGSATGVGEGDNLMIVHIKRENASVWRWREINRLRIPCVSRDSRRSPNADLVVCIDVYDRVVPTGGTHCDANSSV